MAIVIRSAEMPDVQGRAGGEVHRHDACGDHIQAYYGPPRGQASAAQRAQRNAFRTCLSFWKANITWEAAAYWQQYSNRHPGKSKKGITTNLTAWQMFLKINLVRTRNDLAPNLLPPEN